MAYRQTGAPLDPRDRQKIGSDALGALRYSCARMHERASRGGGHGRVARGACSSWPLRPRAETAARQGVLCLSLSLCLCLGQLLVPAEALGEGPEPAADEKGMVLDPVQEAGPPPDVPLDDLLRLPDGFGAGSDRRGGATRPEWLERFSVARADFEEAKQKLTELDAELDKVSASSSSWQVSAPGGSDPQTSPLSLRLRQDIKAQRERIDEAERALRALHVEADLAAVPTDWRGGEGGK